MIGQFPNSLRYRPAYLSGRFGRFEGEFARYESLEAETLWTTSPSRRSPAYCRRRRDADRIVAVGRCGPRQRIACRIRLPSAAGCWDFDPRVRLLKAGGMNQRSGRYGYQRPI